METFYLILLSIVSLFLYGRLRSRIEVLTQKTEELQLQLKNLGTVKNATPSVFTSVNKAANNVTNDINSNFIQVKAESPAQATSAPNVETPRGFPKIQTQAKAEQEPQPRLIRDSALWKNLETQIAGNATGVLGTLAVVLGVIFLAVYAAIQLEPAGRFGIVCLFSLGLYFSYFLLSKKTFWKNISLWLRSASGIIFLIGCLGSVGIDSMKWVNDPMLALALLGLGLFTNVAFGFLNGGQIFASIHVVLSFLALSLLPVNDLLFAVSALVAFVGIIASFQERRWDQHIVATTLGFTLLHFYWLSQAQLANPPYSLSSLIAILLCSLVGLAGIVVHYKKTYESTGFQKNPMLAHLLSWTTMGINVFAHAQGSKYSSILLFVAAVCAYLMSKKAKALSVHWLFVCDRLMSLVLGLLAIISLNHVGISSYEITILAAITAILFTRLSVQDFDKTILRVSCGATLFAYSVVLVYTFIEVATPLNKILNPIFLILVSFIVFCIVYPFIKDRAEKNSVGALLNFADTPFFATFLEVPLALHGFLALLIAMRLSAPEPFLLIPISIISCTLFYRDKIKQGLLDATVLATTLMSSGFILALVLIGDISIYSKVELCIANFVFGALALRINWSDQLKQKVTWPGITILWATAMAVCYEFSFKISPILPGLLWLLVALVAVEIKNIKKMSSESSNTHEQSEKFIGFFGMLSILFFLIRFFLVDISNEALSFGVIRLRYFSEFLFLGTVAYWMIFARFSKLSWVPMICEYFLELFLMITSLFILLEIDNSKHPLIWSLGSLLCLFAAKKWTRFTRLHVYSYCYYFFGLFSIAFLSTTLAAPSLSHLDQPWLIGLIGILTSTLFMVLVHRERKNSPSIELNSAVQVKFLQPIVNAVKKYQLKILLYPLFIAVAFFLFWTFDKAILSLLWVFECFVLFLISIVLREPQFRIFSMAGIGAIFIRIIFYDLTGKDFFVKAVVFILVGIILIAMNTIYNKYKYRYDAK